MKKEYYINFAFEPGYFLVYKYKMKDNEVVGKDDIEDALSSFLETKEADDMSYEDIAEAVLASFNIEFTEIDCITILV